MQKNCFFILFLFFSLTVSGIKPQSINGLQPLQRTNTIPAVAYKYQSVPGDPLQVRIYTLENGLKVYLSVNKDKPRIQSYIGIRVGGKNDPAETTGLAHYFEHLMFKGTKNFGTMDYEAEKPLLDQIEALFETYRKTTDEEKRKEIYAEIDRISQEAAQIAIPNEYEKLMVALGAQATNAFTSVDVTAYMEDIPANEIEHWAMVQSDRFINPVIRGFHTELETVYEEYNMILTRDVYKVRDATFSGLFPHHPYGTQTVIGTQEHLKNPSITNIKNYFDTYYVPNNMAICMAGDFNPDEVIAIIDNYFGRMKPKDIPTLKTSVEQPITSPIVKEVIGLEAENITIAFRMPAANTKEAVTLQFVDYLLSNGQAGLIDLNLVQKQNVLRAGSVANAMTDYSVFQLSGTPKEGQTLEEVRDLLLEQVEQLKKGEIEDWLLKAVINNFRLSQYYQRQEYQYVAYSLLHAFTHEIDWNDQVHRIDYQSKLTKQDVVDFCNNYFNDNYVIVYKRKGAPDDKKIDKPQITPIPTNLNAESAFMGKIKAREIKPIEPVFMDYSKDMAITKAKQNIPLLYKHNALNPVFSLYFIYEMGQSHDKALGTAFNYLSFLGTSTKTAEEIKSELYKIACSFGVSTSDDRVYVSVRGLSDNFEQALALLEERLTDAKADREVYNDRVSNILKTRSDAKSNQQANFSMLTNYAIWGPQSPAKNILSEAELFDLDPEKLVDRIKQLKNLEHTIMYYGPLTVKRVTDLINKKHAIAPKLQPVPSSNRFTVQETVSNNVLLAHYDSKQIYMSMTQRGCDFDKQLEVSRNLYNNYFDGGPSGIVYQEMRETRGLAYAVYADYQRLGKPIYPYLLKTFIATQNDKMMEAIEAFNNILNELPESENTFALSKEQLLTDIRTERILREDILWNYLNAKEFGYATDPRKELFEKIPGMTLQDVKAFQQKHIRNKAFTYSILGDLKALDIESLKKIGPVTILTQEDIFGY